MAKGKSSGISLTNSDARKVLGMVIRGDREHDIAAWFGVNQGRIAEVKEGSHGSLAAAPATELPPKGPPGLKGRRLKGKVDTALELLNAGTPAEIAQATKLLEGAKKQFEADET